MKVRGGEFSTGTMGNFQPELTFSHSHCKTRPTIPNQTNDLGMYYKRT